MSDARSNGKKGLTRAIKVEGDADAFKDKQEAKSHDRSREMTGVAAINLTDSASKADLAAMQARLTGLRDALEEHCNG